MCGGDCCRQPSGSFSDVAICAGLRPEDVLVYVERSQGRANRPYQKLSTVAATSAALCKVTECFVGENKTGDIPEKGDIL
jgi:hypothetical protein